MSFRTALILLNGIALVVIAGVLVYRVVSLRRNPEVRPPANLAEPLADDDFEGRKLERVLGWSLLFTLVIAVSLPLYFLAEPTRQDTMADDFLERSIERGAILFANSQSPEFNSTRSLLCADCHGVDGTGGSAPFTLQPEADKCLEEENRGNAEVPECLPRQVSWQAPDLTLALLRYDRDQVASIITFGRPGTPMPAWGVESGQGVLNAQGIDDLTNYLESIETTSAKAQAAALKTVAKYKQDATDLVEQKTDALEQAQSDLAEATRDGIPVEEEEVATAQAELDTAIILNEEAQSLSQGATLFRLNCARCHTKGWSYHATEPARADLPALAPQGSGAFGPDLRSGRTLLQFPGEAGVQEQFNWVAIGAAPQQLYGNRGISSGRMPHFGQVLTDDQIRAIVEYERSL